MTMICQGYWVFVTVGETLFARTREQPFLMNGVAAIQRPTCPSARLYTGIRNRTTPQIALYLISAKEEHRAVTGQSKIERHRPLA